MKIIFVTREGYNLAGGRIRAYNFARQLSRQGIDTKVLSYADTLGAKDGINEGSMRLSERIKHNISAYKRLCREKDAIIVLQRVNYHAFAPIISHLLKRNQLVLDIDDWEIREDIRYIIGLYPTSKAEFLTRRIAGASNFCIAGSLYLKDYLSRFNKNVYYVPSCVDTEKFCPNGRRTGDEVVKFVWTGTLHRRDDVENVRFIVDCFIELRRELPNISLDIIGDGIFGKEVSSYISNHGLNVAINFMGWVEPDKIPLYLKEADIGLFPLIQNTRFNLSKSPTKLFEYMAMGKSAIASSTGEAKSVIDDGMDGFLASDKNSFIDKMRILSKSQGLRQDMGKAAREKIVSNYSLKMAGDVLSSAFLGRSGVRR